MVSIIANSGQAKRKGGAGLFDRRVGHDGGQHGVHIVGADGYVLLSYQCHEGVIRDDHPHSRRYGVKGNYSMSGGW